MLVAVFSIGQRVCPSLTEAMLQVASVTCMCLVHTFLQYPYSVVHPVSVVIVCWPGTGRRGRASWRPDPSVDLWHLGNRTDPVTLSGGGRGSHGQPDTLNYWTPLAKIHGASPGHGSAETILIFPARSGSWSVYWAQCACCPVLKQFFKVVETHKNG